MTLAALGLSLAFVQMLAWQYVEVPCWCCCRSGCCRCWNVPCTGARTPLAGVLILVAAVGAGVSLWWVWPEASLYDFCMKTGYYLRN